jgi:hypothetical protein
VDGHRVEPGWEGYYFPGMQIALSVPAEQRSAFTGWRVNGAERHEPELTVTASEDLAIELPSSLPATH